MGSFFKSFSSNNVYVEAASTTVAPSISTLSLVYTMQWWAKLLRLLTVNSLSYFVKIKY
jgi:hypothetical protein